MNANIALHIVHLFKSSTSENKTHYSMIFIDIEVLSIEVLSITYCIQGKNGQLVVGSAIFGGYLLCLHVPTDRRNI